MSTKDFTICIGTVGAGVWHSSNAGQSWRRSRMELPFDAQPGEIQIRAIAVSFHDPAELYAGSEAGIYRSTDRGATWTHLDSPMDGAQIWSVTVHPEEPATVLAGTKPPAVYRSRDRGGSWERLPLETADRCLAGAPKVTNVVVDPRDGRRLWVGVEIDGVYRSDDAGATWDRLPDLGAEPINQDIHGLAISPGEPARIYASTPDGLWTSTDEGLSWRLQPFPRFFDKDKVSYCRGIAIKRDDPQTLFVGNGDFIPGKIGAIQCTRDGGETWSKAPLPQEPNSTVYWFGTHPADPDVVVANSIHGYVYLTTDGGRQWQKSPREFGEIRAIAWTPNPA